MKAIDHIIYYIDDDPDDLWLFEQAAKSVGKTVLAFMNYEHLLTTMLSGLPQPSVVFVDLNMGKRSGVEVVTDIKQHNELSRIPLIIYSTADNRVSVETCRKLGTSLYVVKPTKMKAVAEMINQVSKIDWINHRITDQNYLVKLE